MSSKSSNAGSGQVYLVVRTRSILACILHWTLFLSILTLITTGLYIANPSYYFGQGEAYQAFAMANMRKIHFIAAAFMIVVLFARLYLSFTHSCNRDIKQFMPTWWNILNALRLAKFYAFGLGKHAHYRFVNPLGGIGVFLMSVCMLIQVITGFLLYLPGAHPDSIWWSIGNSIEITLGGQQNIRLIHHMVLFILVSIIFIHIYVQIWENSMFTESNISSIIAGYKIFPVSQIGHFADHYGYRLDEEAPTKREMDKVSTPMEEKVDI